MMCVVFVRLFIRKLLETAQYQCKSTLSCQCFVLYFFNLDTELLLD